nr:hypothetical protein BACY1_18270 [Tenacibaculum mesophilum]
MKKNIDISDYFSKEDYNYISSFNNNKLKGVKHHNSIDYFKDIDKRSFKEFSLSRSSVRSFKEEKISKERIEKVINLANNAPSVCNRQASRVFLLEDKDKIDQTLKIQKGLRGYESQIKQLMVLTVDRSFFIQLESDINTTLTVEYI